MTKEEKEIYQKGFKAGIQRCIDIIDFTSEGSNKTNPALVTSFNLLKIVLQSQIEEPEDED